MAVTSAEINAWLSANKGATDSQIRSAMDQHGVSAAQMSRATGTSLNEVTSRYNAAAPAPAATAPAPTTSTATSTYTAPKPATGVTNDEINAWLTANPKATDKDIRLAMQQYNVTPEQMAQATGLGASNVQLRYDSTFTPWADTHVTGWGNPITENEVRLAYQQGFGRQPSQDEINRWVNDPNVRSHNFAGLLYQTATGEDQQARSYTDMLREQNGYFNTDFNRTWSNNLNPLLESEPGRLEWNEEENRWYTQEELRKMQQAPQVSAPSQSGNFNPNFDRQVTPEELVEMRVANLIEKGHPLLEQARQRTLEQFASRGLLNSSVAAQAAQEAVLAKAIEMASQDANTVNRQGMANQAFQNEFSGREQIQNYTRENNYQDYLYRGDLMERELNLRNQFQTDSEGRNELLTSRQRYQDTLAQYQRDYQNQYQRLVEMEGVDAGTKNRMLDDLNMRYQAMYRSTNAIYSKVPDWQNDWLAVFG